MFLPDIIFLLPEEFLLHLLEIQSAGDEFFLLLYIWTHIYLTLFKKIFSLVAQIICLQFFLSGLWKCSTVFLCKQKSCYNIFLILVLSVPRLFFWLILRFSFLIILSYLFMMCLEFLFIFCIVLHWVSWNCVFIVLIKFYHCLKIFLLLCSHIH